MFSDEERAERAKKPSAAGGAIVGALALLAFFTCVGGLSQSPTAPTPSNQGQASATKPAATAPKKKTAAEIEADARVAKFGARPIASAWDGRYLEVERYLKATARDPDSVEFDGCTEVSVTTDGWLVGCNWRARNGFGGMNRQANWFTIRNGRVVTMHDFSAFKE